MNNNTNNNNNNLYSNQYQSYSPSVSKSQIVNNQGIQLSNDADLKDGVIINDVTDNYINQSTSVLTNQKANDDSIPTTANGNNQTSKMIDQQFLDANLFLNTPSNPATAITSTTGTNVQNIIDPTPIITSPGPNSPLNPNSNNAISMMNNNK
jgi:hypothetical protein